MNRRYGFFDVDNLELDPSGQALSFRPRVAPVVGKLQALYRYIDEHDHPLVFTTCCSGRMLERNSFDNTLYIPLEKTEEEWTDRVNDYRRFYLAKKAYGDPKVNFQCRAFDMFGDNENAARLLQLLHVDRWIVFGNGFDLCVNAAVAGVLESGHAATLIEDLRISSAGGTVESERQTLAELKNRGADTITFADFLAGTTAA